MERVTGTNTVFGWQRIKNNRISINTNMEYYNGPWTVVEVKNNIK